MTKRKIKNSFVLQQTESSCGLACLCSVIRYYGKDISQEQIRFFSGTNTNGTTLLGLYQASQSLGYDVNGYETEINELKKLKHPVILPVVIDDILEHYVVCYEFTDELFVIGDPAKGIVKLSESEVEKIWKVKCLLLINPPKKENFRKNTNSDKISWFINTIKPDIAFLFVSAIIGILISVLSLSVAIFSQKLIDNLLPTHKNDQIIIGFIFLFLILSISFSLSYIKSIIILLQGRIYKKRLLEKLIHRVFNLPKSFYNGIKTGDVINRLNDSERIQSVIVDIVNTIIIEVFIFVFTSIYLFHYSWQIALIVFLYVPILAVISFLFSSKINAGQRNVMIDYSNVESNFINTISGIDTIQVFNLQENFITKSMLSYSKAQDSVYRLGKLNSKFNFIINTLTVIVIVSVFSISAYFVSIGTTKIGVLVAVISLLSTIISSAIKISSFIIRYNEANVAFDRIYDFYRINLEEGRKTILDTESNTFDKNENNLDVHNLSFRHIGQPLLLSNINLQVKTGQIVTIFGEVGTGKTTILHLIERFYDLESGNIFFNGKDINEFSLEAWRSKIGVCFQETKIFSGTIAENITFSNGTKSALIFCNQYGFNYFFDQLPMGIETIIHENGINISGGQRQLIGIARALYNNPKILILDEPTAALDYKSTDFIRELLVKSKKKMAIIINTHHKEIAKVSDLIYILQNGQIVDFGSPDDLNETNNFFSNYR
jgi:ATP-binding cassette, subfamily C, bacteriocin exporter